MRHHPVGVMVMKMMMTWNLLFSCCHGLDEHACNVCLFLFLLSL